MRKYGIVGVGSNFFTGSFRDWREMEVVMIILIAGAVIFCIFMHLCFDNSMGDTRNRGEIIIQEAEKVREEAYMAIHVADDHLAVQRLEKRVIDEIVLKDGFLALVKKYGKIEKWGKDTRGVARAHFRNIADYGHGSYDYDHKLDCFLSGTTYYQHVYYAHSGWDMEATLREAAEDYTEDYVDIYMKYDRNLLELGLAGEICKALLANDRDILMLIDRLGEFESRLMPLPPVREALGTAHDQIVNNLERAVVYLSLDGCFEDFEYVPSKKHVAEIRDILTKNEEILRKAMELLDMATETVMDRTFGDRTDEVLAELKACLAVLDEFSTQQDVRKSPEEILDELRKTLQ